MRAVYSARLSTGSVRAGRLAGGQLLQVARDVPSPELDHMASGIGDVSGPPSSVAVLPMIVVENRVATASNPLHHCVVGLRRYSHRVVDMDPAATSTQSDLRLPQSNTGPLTCHHPDCIAIAVP